MSTAKSVHKIVASLAVCCITFSGQASAGQTEDLETTNAVKSAIATAIVRKPAEITVNVKDATVELGGWAYNNFELRNAMQAAMKASGVKKVYASQIRTWSN